MATIQSLGIGSGLLTSELVDDIIAAEREATDLRLTAERAEVEARISAFGSIRSEIDTLRSATSALATSDSLLTNAVSSSNETAVGATATAAANPAVHTVEVFSIARAHTLATVSYESLDSIVGDGTLAIRFGTTTFTNGAYDSFSENTDRDAVEITIDEENNTLEGVRDTINAAGVGVTASIANTGDGFVLVLSSATTGADNSLELTVTEGTTAGLSALAFNAGAATAGVNLTQTVAADDAVMSVDGITITRENNTFDDVIEGVTFTARSLNVGSPATVTVAQDTADLEARFQAFVDAFNSVRSLTEELTDFDPDAGTGALLIGDATLRTVDTQLRRFLSATVSDLTSTTLRSLVDIGLTTNQNNDFALELDVEQLRSALNSDPDGVVALLAESTSTSDSQLRFTSFQSTTQAGTYDINITQLQTQGTLQGASTAALASATTIDADNDSFTIVVDGTQSNALTLTQGTYADSDALAAEIQTQLNNDEALKAAGASVTVAYDATNQRFEFTSALFGSASQVGIVAVDDDVEAELGLAIATGESTKGVDTAGTINGIQGTGSGPFLTVPVGPVEATAGFFRGQATAGFSSPLTINSSNNNFVVAVDGVTSGGILLTEQDYATGAELATEIQTQINNDTTLNAAGITVAVTYDSTNERLTISSNTTGSGSKVDVVSISSGVTEALGLTATSGEPGRAATTISDDAGGLQIQVLGGTTGFRGTATLVRGALNKLEVFLDSALGFGGTLDTKLTSLDSQLDELETEASDLDRRMTLLTERLRSQFAVADALISELNSTSEFLTQQLAALSPGNDS